MSLYTGRYCNCGCRWKSIVVIISNGKELKAGRCYRIAVIGCNAIKGSASEFALV
ncbi:hypothetical protein D3C85_1697500 [compost metagenome]